MTHTMKALVSYAPYDYRYEDVPIPALKSGEVLIKVKGCGICAGDVKAFHGGIRIWGTSEENRYIEAPCIGGHEFCGEVTAMAPDVKDFEIGELVAAEQIVPCNECQFCKEGTYWMCTRSAVYGFKQYANGGFAEYVVLNKNSIIHKMPKSFSVEQAVLVEPIACGMHAVELANIKHTDTVVVSGLGTIGLSMLNMISLYLPKNIIGIDVKKIREEEAIKFGANVFLNPLECNVKEEIAKYTDGLGCDVYIEASGNAASVKQGLDILKNHGRYVQMGVFADEVSADWNIIGDGKELTILGSHLSAKTYDAVIKGIERGLIRTEGLISHTYSLEKWKEAFDEIGNNPEVTKIMLVP